MSGYRLNGQSPQLAADVFVAPGSHLIGQVTVGAGSSIWFGAVLRGDNAPITLGTRCNVQEGAVLHTDPGFALQIGEEVTIGHQAMLHGCRIGAGSLVPEGREFPPRSLILGTPAKAVRPLTEDEVARLRQSAALYAEKGRQFATGLEPEDERLV